MQHTFGEHVRSSVQVELEMQLGSPSPPACPSAVPYVPATFHSTACSSDMSIYILRGTGVMHVLLEQVSIHGASNYERSRIGTAACRVRLRSLACKAQQAS